MNKILLVIPAYNEADNIEAVISELSSYPELDYVIVTDGSTDGTDEICRRNHFNTVYLPVNLGLAGCFQTGMKYAFERGYEYAVQYDGDGQHRPEYIMPMYDKMSEGADIVLGSRFAEKKEMMQGMRGFGSRMIKLAVRLTTGIVMTDPTCGLRMYNRAMIEKFAFKLNYAPEPDTISYLVKNGAVVREVQIEVRDREAGESYLNPVNAVKYMLRMLVSILFIQNFRNKSE